MKVMVAVENDNFARMAIAALEQRTWPVGTEFILVHVIESEFYNFKGSPESLRHQINLSSEENREHQKQHAWLCELVSENEAHLGNMRFVIVTGDVTYCLKQLSTVLKPDYVVMTSHERSSKQRIWLKSMCASVVDVLNSSIEVLKPSSAKNLVPKKILVALDGSENSLKALNWLVDQELSSDVSIKLVMVLEVNQGSELRSSKNLHSSYSSTRWSTKYNFRLYAREWFDETLCDAKKCLKNNHVEGSCLEGEVASTIISEASQWAADLIVVGSHGEKGLSVDGIKKSSGSTTQMIIENAHQNIIVINSNATELPSFKWNEDKNQSLAVELGKVSK